MIYLNSFLPVYSLWHLDVATAINNSGGVTGYRTFNGVQRAFVLDTFSTPEPAFSALLGGGLVDLALKRKRRTRQS